MLLCVCSIGVCVFVFLLFFLGGGGVFCFVLIFLFFVVLFLFCVNEGRGWGFWPSKFYQVTESLCKVLWSVAWYATCKYKHSTLGPETKNKSGHSDAKCPGRGQECDRYCCLKRVFVEDHPLANAATHDNKLYCQAFTHTHTHTRTCMHAHTHTYTHVRLNYSHILYKFSWNHKYFKLKSQWTNKSSI